mmetsp:Transcript_12645/g.22346  ORF Transcript_12645/g.22346 Transcript_12645/m.22346 type:complete len:99 (+) Transcript_12645:1031-1327(+)
MTGRAEMEEEIEGMLALGGNVVDAMDKLAVMTGKAEMAGMAEMEVEEVVDVACERETTGVVLEVVVAVNHAKSLGSDRWNDNIGELNRAKEGGLARDL